jgi:hypothetical protein
MTLRKTVGYSILISLLLGILITVAAVQGILGVLALLVTLATIALVVLAAYLIE